MRKPTSYLDLNVSTLEDDQIWVLREALMEGRAWLDDRYEKLSKQEANVVDELGKRLEQQNSDQLVLDVPSSEVSNDRRDDAPLTGAVSPEAGQHSSANQCKLRRS